MLTLDNFTKDEQKHLFKINETYTKAHLNLEILRLFEKKQHDPFEPRLGMDTSLILKEIKRKK